MNNFDALFDSQFKPKITPEISAAVKATWNAIGPDVDAVDDNESAVEMYIDHLSNLRYHDEERELTEMIEEFGYQVVLKALAKEVRIV